MLRALLISSILTLVHSISDLVYFEQSQPSFSAKLILANVTKVTLRSCQIACADSEPLCTALSYAHPPNCVLLGDVTDGASCGALFTVSEKKQRKPDERKRFDIIADYLPDPCYTTIHPDKTLENSATGICMRNNQLNLVIRAVNESGSTITLDNDVNNVLTYEQSRDMWKYAHAPTGFVQWLVGLCCVETKSQCSCDPLPMMDESFGIRRGVEAQVDAVGACADRTHQLTRVLQFPCMAGKFKAGVTNVEISPENAGKMRITCHAGIWLLTYLDNSNGWQITSATCSKMINRDPQMFSDAMGTDPCVTDYFQGSTKQNGAKGICTRDARSLVIRGVYEDGTRVTLDNNLQNVLGFDSARNMWKFSYATRGFERWLVAVSCVRTKNTESCGCAPLPMMDARYAIVGGVEAQVDAPGACRDPSHRLIRGRETIPPALHFAHSLVNSTGERYKITCQAGIWLYTKLDNSDGWHVTNVTCWPSTGSG